MSPLRIPLSYDLALIRILLGFYTIRSLIPVAVRSKAWVCGRSLAGIAGSNPAEDIDVCLSQVMCFVK
jgi:hypothetical protein